MSKISFKKCGWLKGVYRRCGWPISLRVGAGIVKDVKTEASMARLLKGPSPRSSCDMVEDQRVVGSLYDFIC